jgi:two-component sensor histidine kinase
MKEVEPLRLVTLKLDGHGDIPRLRQVGLGVTHELGFEGFAQTRVVTALVELGRNAVVHGSNGRTTLAVTPRDGRVMLVATVSDDGKGPTDAGGRAERSAAGKGLGLGLRGVERIADRLEVESGERGTRVVADFVTPGVADDIGDLAARLTDAIALLNPIDPATALAQQNQELLRAVSERDLLLQEVHHRTRNNLTLISSLVKLSARSAESEEARERLADLSMRIEAVIGVHEQLERSETGEALSLRPFLRGIADRIQSAFSSNGARVRIDVDGDDLLVEGRLGVDVGLIVGELVTNALKHAFADRSEGRIAIALRGDDEAGTLEVTVHDDGPGLPDGMDRPTRPSSLGWRVVESMAARYAGRIDVTNRNGLCVRVTLEEPGRNGS